MIALCIARSIPMEWQACVDFPSGGVDLAFRRATIQARDTRLRGAACATPADLAQEFKEKGIMRLLLTSAGIKNPSIHQALVEMLGKPTAEANALCIPTASYGHPMAGPRRAWSFITGIESSTPMVELGWKSMGVLELTALPSINRERWERWVQEADVLLVNGGDSLYLHYWMQQSGLANLLPSWPGVYVGLSAGSMVMTPRIGEEFVIWKQPGGGDETLGLVDFSIYPHLDHPALPENTMANAVRWAANLPGPAYAIDDETAIRVVNGAVDVISEGQWRFFTP